MKLQNKYANYKRYKNNFNNNYNRNMSRLWSDYTKTENSIRRFIDTNASIFTIIENYFKYKSLNKRLYK